MSADECIHGVWPSTSCTLCSGKAAREREQAEREAATVHHSFRSKFPGVCAKCGDHFDSGETIAKMANELIYCSDCAGLS